MKNPRLFVIIERKDSDNFHEVGILSKDKEKNVKKGEKSLIFTAETLGVALILFSVLCLICLVSRDKIFSLPGLYVCVFLYGATGWFSYVGVALCVLFGIRLVSGKKSSLSGKRKALIFATVFCALLLFQVISMRDFVSLGYGEYIAKAYSMGENVSSITAGGALTATVSWVFSRLLTNVGSYIILSALLCLSGYFLAKDIYSSRSSNKNKIRGSYSVADDGTVVPDVVGGIKLEGERDYPVEGVTLADKTARPSLFVSDPSDFGFKTKKDVRNGGSEELKLDFDNMDFVAPKPQSKPVSTADSYSRGYDKEMMEKIRYVKTPAKINVRNAEYDPKDGVIRISDPLPKDDSDLNKTSLSAKDRAEDFENKYGSVPEYGDDAQSFDRPATPKTGVFDGINTASERSGETFRATERQTGVVRDGESVSSSRNQGSVFDGFSHDSESDIPFFDESADSRKVSDDEPRSSVLRGDRARDIFGRNDRESRQEYGFVDGRAFRERDDSQRGNSSSDGVAKERANERTDGLRGREDVGRVREDNDARSDNRSGNRSESISNLREIFGGEERNSRRIDPLPDIGRSSPLQSEPIKTESVEKEEEEKKEKKQPPINRVYNRPPLELLKERTPPDGLQQEDHEKRKEIIQTTLQNFHINVQPMGVVQGPSITRYELMMPADVTVKKILTHDKDLSMRLSVKGEVRIEAPIPGKDLVGIEVPNKVRVTVGMRSLLREMATKKTSEGSLQFAIGKDVVGNVVSGDMARGKHFLVAGSTGSGKSVCLNVMIVSLIMRYSPEELRLILIDPKRVEFKKYEGLPHLVTPDIISDPPKALASLMWARQEMERRYETFEKSGPLVVDIESYNENVACATVPKMPRIVIVMDELANLMETSKKEFEAVISTLCAKARAAGIHLVLATQRPSVDIITGVIKANLPSRMALRVMSYNDSQTILGGGGAEKLLGYGDMLYKSDDMSDYERYQGAYIDSGEINAIVSYIKEHNEAYFDDDFDKYIDNAVAPAVETPVADDDKSVDPDVDLIVKALATAITENSVSISSLQRRFGFGFNKAGRIVDKMARAGYISGQQNGGAKRKVFVTKEDFENKYGDITKYLE